MLPRYFVTIVVTSLILKAFFGNTPPSRLLRLPVLPYLLPEKTVILLEELALTFWREAEKVGMTYEKSKAFLASVEAIYLTPTTMKERNNDRP